ncbi:MAG: Eco57I restriction-modification methylase domain-containing protein [Christensenellales bacterium]|jgi:adenine-specific DNA-methyltransferase
MDIKKASKNNAPTKFVQMSMFDEEEAIPTYKSPFEYIGDKNLEDTMAYFDEINKDGSHYNSNDDVCTPMACVKLMIDYIPDELWQRKNLRILEPCAGNGNFGAYCKFKTDIGNIWFNELNIKRYKNCKKLLKPKHISHEDFFCLENEWASGFDLIMANPPYSGGGNKNQSLSNKFIEKSIDMLNDLGYLCYVTPNNWMTYNSNNTTLKKLLREGSFLVIDNDAKKYFPGIGSSFTIIIWQKSVFDNKTYVVNSFLKNDIQKEVHIPSSLKFIPLYISQTVLDIIPKIVTDKRNTFDYRCDLHNFTKKALLSDFQDDTFRYRTIHTMRKTRYAVKKQDIYDKWIIIIPLSTYYIPVIEHNANTTQSVGYIPFETREEAEEYLEKITKPEYKLIVHLTRYGNFNNIMVLRYMNFDDNIKFTKEEAAEINSLVSLIKY